MTMKKVFLVFCLMVMSTKIFSQILEENFEYPSGDSIGAHGWINFSGGIVNRLLVTSPGLVYPEYGQSGIGNATTLATTGQDDYKEFTTPRVTGSLYASFMVNVDSAKAAGDYFCAFLSSTSTTGFYGRCYVKKASNGNFAFGISKTTAGSGGIFYGDSVYTTGITYLLVLKYTFNTVTTTDDQVSLFVFTSGIPNSEPTPTIGPITGTANDPSDLGRFALRQGTTSSSPELKMDGISVSTSWNTALPVELAAFTSTLDKRNVSLNWVTEIENNNHGFDVERMVDGYEIWTKIAFSIGAGNSNLEKHYTFLDKDLNSGIYKYRLKQIDYNGDFKYYPLNEEITVGQPDKYLLLQNYPNPFNPVTRIDYQVPASGLISVTLYDISGKEVKSLVNERKETGFYSLILDASALSSGVYFYSLRSTGFESTKRMLLIK